MCWLLYFLLNNQTNIFFMKISKNLLAAIALTLGTSVSLTSCVKDEVITVTTDEKGNETVIEGEQNPTDNCPACGMG
jgi:hypothetical protein